MKNRNICSKPCKTERTCAFISECWWNLTRLLQHLKLCLILFLSDFYLPCEKRWAVLGKLALFFHFLVLNVFVSLMLRKHTLWLNFLSYKRPQCTSYPFLPVAKYFDLWRLGLLRESNKILANIISFFLHLPFLPFK